MTEEIKEEVGPLATTFGELDNGQIFEYLDEAWKKVSPLRAIRQSDSLDWMFPIDTEINS